MLRILGAKIFCGKRSDPNHGWRTCNVRLVFHFKDGSIDEETVAYSERNHFRLISDHHIQRGPTFPKPTDGLINASTGEVTVRYEDKGKENTETNHLDLPSDLGKGILPNMLEKFSPGTRETRASYRAATPKPRLVKLSIMRQGEDTFSIANAPRKEFHFTVRAELGGITGVVAHHS